MIEVTFIDHAGTARSVNAAPGDTLMQVARSNDIPGIDADCGGVCACATCHVYVAEAFLGKLPPLTDAEDPMLDFVEERRTNSRLSCQLVLTQEYDGISVETPASQK